MSEPTDRKVTRAALEQQLHELSGFRADASDIARFMVSMDTYAIGLAEDLGPRTEAHLHLLRQQAELLLDSGVVVSGLEDRIRELSGQVKELTHALNVRATGLTAVNEILMERTEVMSRQLDDHLAWAASHDHPHEHAGIELTSEMRQAVREVLEPDTVTQITRLAEQIPDPADWERDLLEGRLPVVRTGYLVCTSCGQAKDRDEFYNNTKSPTGKETKCKACSVRKRRAA